MPVDQSEVREHANDELELVDAVAEVDDHQERDALGVVLDV